MQIYLSGRRILSYLFRTTATWSSDIKTNQKPVGKNLETLPLYSQMLRHRNDICIQDNSGRYTYSLLHHNSKRLSRQISNICGSRSSSTVGIFCSHNVLTILIIWASWLSGQKVLLLGRGLPLQQLQSLAKETKLRLVISADFFEKQSKKLCCENGIPLIQVDSKFLCNHLEQEIPNNNYMLNADLHNEAFIVYSRENVAKTTLTTHEELRAKVENVLKSWTLTKNDKVMYMCPSFYQYNEEFIFNLYFSLSVGSQLHLFNPFDSKAAWQTILGINIRSKDRVNVLIAEPKVYQQLIEEYKRTFAGDKRLEENVRIYCLQNIRFMLSCFYATDPKTSSTWHKITGLYLQESHFSIENTSRKIEANVNAETISKIINIHGVTHAENTLSELKSARVGKFPIMHIAIIGRLSILNQDDLFLHTAEIGSYCNGFLKTIGRYYRHSSY